MSDEHPLAPEFSPLEEADPNAVNVLISDRINRILNTRPLDLTDDDLSAAIDYYRKERARFILESQNKVPRAVAAAAKRKVPTSVADAIATSVDLLG